MSCEVVHLRTCISGELYPPTCWGLCALWTAGLLQEGFALREGPHICGARWLLTELLLRLIYNNPGLCGREHFFLWDKKMLV